MRKQIAAVAVAALLVFAGCSAGGNGGATTAPETTAGGAGDPVYESPLDAQTVAQTHESVVRDAGTFTLVSTSNRTQGGQSVSVQSSTAVDLATGAYFATQESPMQTVEQFGFGNGTAYQRVSTADNQTRYTIPREAPNTSQLAGSQLESFVGAFSFSHTGSETVDGTDTHVYEASGVEDLNQSAPGLGSLDTENLTSLTAELYITDDGLVKRFGYSLTVSTSNGEASIATDQRYVDIGSTTVSEPAWLDEARANTSA
ncbi:MULTISPECIES: hypothetical protein [Halobacterium]|uniref:DUF7537 family lipoprotein n=1 Tax=Halobacterium TaxID=2239 RepID=UPI00073E5BE6|nr:MULTISPECIES: hypothetical protein [Halobacterium]MCG1003671.1 hypothetical protein [Halobacterium noricense]